MMKRRKVKKGRRAGKYIAWMLSTAMLFSQTGALTYAAELSEEWIVEEGSSKGNQEENPEQVILQTEGEEPEGAPVLAGELVEEKPMVASEPGFGAIKTVEAAGWKIAIVGEGSVVYSETLKSLTFTNDEAQGSKTRFLLSPLKEGAAIESDLIVNRNCDLEFTGSCTMLGGIYMGVGYTSMTLTYGTKLTVIAPEGKSALSVVSREYSQGADATLTLQGGSDATKFVATGGSNAPAVTLQSSYAVLNIKGEQGSTLSEVTLQGGSGAPAVQNDMGYLGIENIAFNARAQQAAIGGESGTFRSIKSKAALQGSSAEPVYRGYTLYMHGGRMDFTGGAYSGYAIQTTNGAHINDGTLITAQPYIPYTPSDEWGPDHPGYDGPQRQHSGIDETDESQEVNQSPLGAGMGYGINGPFFTDTDLDGGTAGNAFIMTQSINDKSQQASWSGVVFEGNTGVVYGKDITLTSDAEIPVGSTLRIGKGKSLSLDSDVTLKNRGVIIIESGGRLEEGGGTIDSKSGVITSDDAVERAEALLEGSTFDVDQIEANTEEAVVSEMVKQINERLAGEEILLTVTEEDITVYEFSKAVAATAKNPANPEDGELVFSVLLHQNLKEAEVEDLTATIHATKQWLEITTAPEKLVYQEEELFSPKGAVISLRHSDGSSEDVTKICKWSGGKLTGAIKKVRVSYKAEKQTFIANQPIQVIAKIGKTYTLSKINYKVMASTAEGGTAAVMGTTSKTLSRLVVPDEVKICGVSYQVIKVAEEAFKDHKTLQEVKLGNNIKSLSKSSFENCEKLTKIAVGRGLNTIGKRAICSCDKLTSFKTTGTPGIVENAAFYNCKKLKSLQIGENITKIGDMAFKGCIKLSGFWTEKKLRTIGVRAFYGCCGIKGFEAGNKLETIGSKAFVDCITLKTFKVGEELTEIGWGAFSGATNLNVLEISSTKLTKVLDGCLYDVKDITIKVPSSKVKAYEKLFEKNGAEKYKITPIKK